MQKLILLIFFLFFSSMIIYGQGMTSREVKKIAEKFTEKLKKKNQPIQHIMVTDFTDGKLAPTEFGRFLAEEFSFYLADLDDQNFSILDRSRLEALLKEQGLIRDELIDPLSAVKLGKIKGMQFLLYGTIIEMSETYTIYVKLIEVETQKIIAASRGNISKVPSMPKHHN